MIEIAKPGRPQDGQGLAAADPGVPEAEKQRSQLGRVVQMKVGERHGIRRGQGDPENGKLLERPQAGVDQERTAAVAEQVAGGPPSGMGDGGPPAKNEAFHARRGGAGGRRPPCGEGARRPPSQERSIPCRPLAFHSRAWVLEPADHEGGYREIVVPPFPLLPLDVSLDPPAGRGAAFPAARPEMFAVLPPAYPPSPPPSGHASSASRDAREKTSASGDIPPSARRLPPLSHPRVLPAGPPPSVL